MSSRHSASWAGGTFHVAGIDFCLTLVLLCRSATANPAELEPNGLFKHFCMCVSCQLVQQMLQIRRDFTSGCIIKRLEACSALFCLFSSP